MNLDRHAEARSETLQRHAQMHFALAEQLDLGEFLIVHVDQRRIFVDELRDGAGEFHLVLAVLHFKRDGVHRLRRWDRRFSDIPVPPARIARERLAALRRRAAEQARDAGNLVLAARGDHGLPVDKGSAQHAGQRQFAAMRGVDRAQDARQRRTLVRNAQPRPRRLDPWRLVAQRLEQPRHPGAARRGTEE